MTKTHNFDLTGLTVGQSFLGCKVCWFQWNFADGMIAPRCPNHCGELRIYTAEEADLNPSDLDAQPRL